MMLIDYVAVSIEKIEEKMAKFKKHFNAHCLPL